MSVDLALVVAVVGKVDQFIKMVYPDSPPYCDRAAALAAGSQRDQSRASP